MALLERTTRRRAFRRVERAELVSLLPETEAGPEAAETPTEGGD